jgi:hypothetical protein
MTRMRSLAGGSFPNLQHLLAFREVAALAASVQRRAPCIARSRDIAAGTLALLPHPGGNVVRRIGLTLRRGWQPRPVQEEFLKLLRAATARIPTRPPHAGGSRPRNSFGETPVRRLKKRVKYAGSSKPRK